MRTTFSLVVLLVWSSLQFVYAQTNPPGLHNQSNIDLLVSLSSKSSLTPQERTQAIQAMLVIANEARQNPNYRKLQGCTNARDLPSGLPKLVLDDRLIKMAQDQANYQASIITLTHDNSNFADYGARVNSYLPGISVPEACGVSSDLSACPINLMKGETHYRPTWNLEGQTVNSVGFGMAKGSDNSWYYTVVWANIPVPVYTVSTAPTGSTVSNVAKGKKASQSSTAFGGNPERALDGNTDGQWGKNSVTHTEDESAAWWELDLGAVYEIDRIVIWNREDCCWERLQNFLVLTSVAPIERKNDNVIFGDALLKGPYSPWSAGQRSFTIEIDKNEPRKKARYIRITLRAQMQNRPLSLAEVEVFGKSL